MIYNFVEEYEACSCSSQLYLWPFEFCKHVRDRAGVMESIAGVSGCSALDHFKFTDVRFGMRVPDTATVF
jgi:hypothetical protein